MPHYRPPKLPRMRGDEERNALVVKWLRYAYSLARRAESRCLVLRSIGSEAVDDLAVDALIRAAEVWDESRGVPFPSYLCPWVLLSVRSRARQILKERDRVPVADGLDPDLFPGEEPGDGGQEAAEQVVRWMRLLTEPQQEALRLLYFEGLASVAAGQKLGVTKSAVLFRRDRAFETIRRHEAERAG